MPDRAESLSFDRVAEEYDATRGGDDRGDVFAPALAAHLPATGTLLEVGVGTGAVAGGLRRLGRDVVGVDLSPAMLARARERLGPRIAVADVQRLPVGDGALAGAYAVWVLHLVADVSATFAELARVLRPGGLLIVVPGDSDSATNTDVERLNEEMWAALQPDGRLDDADRLVALAAPHGLSLVARDTVAGPARRFSPMEWVARVERRSFSVLWEVDDAAWRAVVTPILERGRALPRPGEPRTTVDRYAVLVFTRT